MGVKPLYSKGMVDLEPWSSTSTRVSARADVQTENGYSAHQADYGINMPIIHANWLDDIALVRKMRGCGNAQAFFEGVALKESFEKDWEPLEAEPSLTPVKLIIILDLYFQLTPITMVPETPEIIDLAKFIKTTPEIIAEAMSVFQFCDPYLNRRGKIRKPTPGTMQRYLAEIW